MEESQLSLPIMCRLDGPGIVLPHEMATVKTYRDAVKKCWQLRRVRNMTQKRLAEEAGLYPSHVTWYLHDGKRQCDLPGWAIKSFEAVCGNSAITQFLASQSNLTVMQVMEAAMKEMQMKVAA